MDLLRFNADDIYELRVQMAEKYRNMTEEDAERDYQQRAKEARHALEERRRANALKAG
jgi:hypothetical protein